MDISLPSMPSYRCVAVEYFQAQSETFVRMHVEFNFQGAAEQAAL